ncbi:hypothetical protein G9C85_04045 [Halorubellus sp. JP-L1]|uniref:hypothetical protein n=1 Tax=Halorubellus sp. JP-L1 TaxID=2715753 RepID=UPI0014096B86|nr:hypothetical protein [Halorubellus sp. JP-L1]NHN40806.1 hypothetical protein [Halorubellus sp. JP-L1]
MTVERLDDAVDGYHDVADQLSQYLLSHASEACERERAATRDLDSLEAFERLVLEVLPDYHVTANCYVPAGDGPHPAVVLCGGHHPFPKADGQN